MGLAAFQRARIANQQKEMKPENIEKTIEKVIVEDKDEKQKEIKSKRKKN